MLNLDTHVLLFALSGELLPPERLLLERDDWSVSAIDLAVARASTRLDFESDPADQLIAAASVVHGVPLLTRDRVMRRSKVVPLAS